MSYKPELLDKLLDLQARKITFGYSPTQLHGTPQHRERVSALERLEVH